MRAFHQRQVLVRKRRSSTIFERKGANRRLLSLVVGLLALLINIAAGTVAAQQRHGDAAGDPLAQLAADLAILCESDGIARLPVHHGGGGPAALPHCQSCLPFFSTALAPPGLTLGPRLVFARAGALAPVIEEAPRLALPASSIGARGPPAA